MKNMQRIVLALSLTALLGQSALAAFGDGAAPAANALSGDGAAGSALPPGTYPSSPSDSDKKAEPSPKTEKGSTTGSSSKHDQPNGKTTQKKPPRTGS